MLHISYHNRPMGATSYIPQRKSTYKYIDLMISVDVFPLNITKPNNISPAAVFRQRFVRVHKVLFLSIELSWRSSRQQCMIKIERKHTERCSEYSISNCRSEGEVFIKPFFRPFCFAPKSVLSPPSKLRWKTELALLISDRFFQSYS